MGDAAKAAAAALPAMGRGAKGIDFGGVNENMAMFIAKAKEAEPAVNAAAAVMDNISIAIGSVKIAILQALKPLFDFINALGPGVLSNIAVGFTAIGAALIGLYAGNKVLSFIVEGFGKFAGVISETIKWMTGFSAATATATVATGSLAATEAAAAASFAVLSAQTAFTRASYARLGSATSAVAVEQAALNALISQGIVSGALYDKTVSKLTAAEARLAGATQALSVTQAEFNALQVAGAATSTAAGTAAAANVGIFARLGAAMSAVVAAAAPIAIALGAIAAAVALGTVIYRAFEDEIDNLLGTMWKTAKEMGSGIKDAITGFFDWANNGLTGLAQGLRNVASALGLASNKNVVQAQANKAAPDQSAAETKRLAEDRKSTRLNSSH